MLDAFELAPSGHERVAYLDGVRYRDKADVEPGVATTVTMPDAVTSLGNYTVSAAAMAQAGDHFEILGLVRLAQVHTHGNRWVGHSTTDDRRAYSQRDGALSLVLPQHGLGRPGLAQTGVHLREPSGWRHLSADQIDAVVRIVPGLIDHRSTIWNASPTATKEISAADSNPSTGLGRWPWRWSWRRQRRT